MADEIYQQNPGRQRADGPAVADSGFCSAKCKQGRETLSKWELMPQKQKPQELKAPRIKRGGERRKKESLDAKSLLKEHL